MIRESIKKTMKIRKVKSKDLAAHIGITASTLSLFLSGKAHLGQRNIEAILEYLGLVLVLKEEQADPGITEHLMKLKEAFLSEKQ